MLVIKTIAKKVAQTVKRSVITVHKHSRTIRREYVVEQYLRAGALFGIAIVEHFNGGSVDLDAARIKWARFERMYANLGYRTISTSDFIEIGALGRSSSDLIRVFRGPGEAATHYAELFVRCYPQGFAPEVDIQHVMASCKRCGPRERQDEIGHWHRPEE